MNHDDPLRNEESLDPDDWQSLRQLGHQMVDDMLNFLQRLPNEPVWRKVSQEARDGLSQALPAEAEGIQKSYGDFLKFVLPYYKGNIHPRFWGWVEGGGTPFGMLGEMLAAAMNPNLAIGDHGAVYVEKQVIEWCKQMMGFPPTSSGILVSGGSMANLTALTVARNSIMDMRKKGVRSVRGMLTLYCSAETHSSIQKSVETLGLGSEALRKIPVNSRYEIDMPKLVSAIAQDREAGHTPFCVIGNVGTVNTGAIDPIQDLLELCRKEKLWLHIDGAFGALAVLTDEYKPALKGMNEADSIAFDLHKWMYMQYGVGCVLIRNAELHRSAFSITPEYLTKHSRGLGAGPEAFGNLGIELSHGFRGLKVWLSIKEHGIDKYRRIIMQNILQARYLAEKIKNEARLELVAPVPMNLVCFRFVSNGVGLERLNELNKEILMELHERGIAVPTYTTLNGVYAIRVAITNHRSQKKDFDVLVREVIGIGEELLKN